MPKTVNNFLQDFPFNPHADDTLHLKGIRIGRFRIDELVITGREAAIHAQEILNAAMERSRRSRINAAGTRYLEPLSVGHPARLLSVEIKDYLGDRERRCLSQETIDSTARTLRFLQMTCGDIPVSRIDHPHIYRLWDLMRWSPPGLFSDPAYRGISYDEAIACGKELDVPQLAPATLERHRRFLVSFFNQLVKTKAIDASPMAAFAEIKKDLVTDPNKPERLFDEDDLKRIFDPKTFIPWASKYPHRWWLPMIGLYTGARINEVAQLKVADIVQESEVWCIRIQKTVDPDLAHRTRLRSRQSLKGKASIRTIPIPKPLLDAGFLDFMDDIRDCGHPRLFPHLSAGVNRKTGETNARYSLAALSQFSRYMKDLGFPRGVGFHAFRHTIATELHHQNVADEDIALITGHSVSKRVPVLHEAYFHKKPAVMRRKQIETLEKYRPAVALPVYAKGQFKRCLKDKKRFYP
ncbi:MAG: site-specific integrase [Stenotrophomonas sp.]|uniref:site-specific integrase n=1 Tax=Stenotrophomonas sp. TaxID=69392 RepID=UPI0029A828C4|nr:site-specific integrase [Stenotrophomonas sp.]MDX3930953.1 site-specific integrase [Stenotrophomonas sp.]